VLFLYPEVFPAFPSTTEVQPDFREAQNCRNAVGTDKHILQACILDAMLDQNCGAPSGTECLASPHPSEPGLPTLCVTLAKSPHSSVCSRAEDSA
jgi:hypothetical protein